MKDKRLFDFICESENQYQKGTIGLKVNQYTIALTEQSKKAANEIVDTEKQTEKDNKSQASH